MATQIRALKEKNVWIAQEVEKKKKQIVKAFVQTKGEQDVEFAQNVSKVVEGIADPKERYETEKAVSKEINKIVNLASRQNTVRILREIFAKQPEEPAERFPAPTASV